MAAADCVCAGEGWSFKVIDFSGVEVRKVLMYLGLPWHGHVHLSTNSASFFLIIFLLLHMVSFLRHKRSPRRLLASVESVGVLGRLVIGGVVWMGADLLLHLRVSLGLNLLRVADLELGE